ncbi:MAG TPA: nitroreductase family protein, partial [Polyangiaceae bacterium]|nr:nitroreductase family protein [Polyangiaceae bacterium]
MSSVRIHELLARRLTTHAFDPEERVSRADCSALLRAAHAAPSWNNQQPWRFLVCDRFERPDAWQSAFDALERKERPWAYNAALFIVVAVDLDD